jgi:hypothetical protein
MNADQIEQTVAKLLELVKVHSKEHIDSLEEFESFKKQNRTFYELIIRGEHDQTIFKQMMKMKRQLESGQDQYSVDVKFGTYMSEKFIDPVIKQKN